MTRARLLQAALAAASALLAIAVIAFGDDGGGDAAPAPDRPAQRSETAPNVVTADDLARTEPGSPERALLEWVQSIQYRDGAGALRLVTRAERARASDAAIRAAVEKIGPALARPSIQRVRHAGADTAVVLVLWLSYRPGSTRPALSLPGSVPLRREAGGWRISDSGYILDTAREIRRLARTRRAG